jgi:glycosyltransferase involved in cell wall biosynthesis
MKIICTVTNDLSYDQRMHRICHSLALNGYEVMLVGRRLPHSTPLIVRSFEQKRLHCFAKKGFLFYAEYNLRLFLFLLFRKYYDAVCSIDLDTLPAGFCASVIRRKKRVFDAHEYFTEVPEVVTRPFVRSFWEMVAKRILPFYRHAYTVGPCLAAIFESKYRLKFEVIRNVASRSVLPPSQREIPSLSKPKTLLYQGALNEGRGLEAAIEAMQQIDNVQFVIAGEGDLSENLRALSKRLNLQDKVSFLGFVRPEDLKTLTAKAWVGINLLENKGLSYYYSLANKFFDCVQAEVPIITMDFPEYRALNEVHEVALLLSELSPESVAGAVQKLLTNNNLYARLQQNCRTARDVWHWEAEEKVLLRFWNNVRDEDTAA